MLKPRRLVLVITVTAASIVALGWVGARRTARVETVDTNRDGRSDVWRSYDADGELSRVSIDTNFDSRSDREEEYEHGALWRRRADRDFDGRIDLVEEFAAAGESVRSIVDVDRDGSADLLILFQNGRRVFTETSPRPAKTRSGHSFGGGLSPPDHRTSLMPLDDPFSREVALHSAHELTASSGSSGIATAGSLPIPSFLLICTVSASVPLHTRSSLVRVLAPLAAAPRSPPERS